MKLKKTSKETLERIADGTPKDFGGTSKKNFIGKKCSEKPPVEIEKDFLVLWMKFLAKLPNCLGGSFEVIFKKILRKS